MSALGERSDLGRQLDARRTQLGYTRLEQVAAEAGVSINTLSSLLTGQRKVFRPDILTRLNLAFRLPPGTLEQVLEDRLPAAAVAAIPAAPTGPEFVAHLHTELAARGATIPSREDLDTAAEVWEALGRLLEVTGQDDMKVNALETVISTVRALAGLLESAGVTDRQREALSAVDQIVGQYTHLTERDIARIRSDAVRTSTLPAVTGPGLSEAKSG